MSSNQNESKCSDTVTEKKENVDNDKEADISTRLEDVGPEDIESSETAECVTMVDVLQDENDLEEDARAVLGGADDRNCTYNNAQSNGYLKRQALYACLTCSVPNDPSFKPAGICLACSYACHNDHTLVELYTKRRFRCDCGNSRFPKSNPCKLYENKVSENDKNQYNQNYRGVYCSCHRPYPDEEDTVPDAMIQCAICEDWYHRRHLKVEDDKFPSQAAFAEMICQQCSEKYHSSFLYGYRDLAISGSGKKDSAESLEEDFDNAEVVNTSMKENICPLLPQSNVSPKKGEKAKDSVSKCQLEDESVENMKHLSPSTLFMVPGWRDQLCRCPKCIENYCRLSLDYLLDEEDTLDFYENTSGPSENSEDDTLLKAMSSMNRTQQIEALHGYNMMKNNLTEYLKKFVENKTVVKEEDIQEFFEGLSANKKMRITPPDNCK